jgi:alpha-amylase
VVKLALGLHNHQPVGNIDGVNEHIYNLAYRPFLDVAQQHPRARFNFHISGPLLDWLAVRHPDYLDTVAGLVRKKRVEVVGGGYGEPVLALIPQRDRKGQLVRYADRAEELLASRRRMVDRTCLGTAPCVRPVRRGLPIRPARRVSP